MRKTLRAVASGLLLSTVFSGIAKAECSPNQLGGMVFMDFNADGTQNLGENGADGITVEAYGASGELVASAVTDINGEYRLTAQPQLPVRIQLAGLGAGLSAGPMGSGMRSGVFFTDINGSCNNNFGIFSSSEYCPAERIITSKLVAGDSQSSAQIGAIPALVGYNYSASGEYTSNPPDVFASAAEIGTTWGLAYHKPSKVIFAGAMMKRHAAVGPLGLSGIYKIDLSSGTPAVSAYARLSDFGYDFGTDPRLPGDLSTTLGAPSVDGAAFDMVGKSGFGDLELSEDQTQLFATNLKDRQLYRLTVGSPIAPISAEKISTFDIPNPGCSNSDFLPWALKSYRGALYIGVVCTAETSQLIPDLKAAVLKFNGSTFTSLTEFNFGGYARGTAIHPLSPLFPFVFPDAGGISRPWVSSYTQMLGGAPIVSPGAFYLYAQLALSNIEFDSDGSIILAFKDRSGDQFGYFDFGPVAAPINYELTVPQGDIVRLCRDGSTYVPEFNGGCANDGPTLGQNNTQGPGGGEYYFNDVALDPVALTPVHQEISNGATLLIPQFGELLATSTNPLNTYATGGIRAYSAADAGINRAFEVFGNEPGTFGKSTGLGDIEAICPPAPLQIGNRVWLDSNANGSQDAGEPGLPGVTVTLRDAISGEFVASRLTDSFGHYFFGYSDGVRPQRSYKIIVGSPSDLNSGTLSGLTLTAKNAVGTELDSNGDLTEGQVTASIAVGAEGTFDHSIDFGFINSSCRLVNSASSSAELDGASVALGAIAKQARRRIKNDVAARLCKSSMSAARLNALVNAQERSHLFVWNSAWSYSAITVCDFVPVGCTTTDSSAKLSEIRQELATMETRVQKLLANTCFKTRAGKRAAKVFRSGARLARTTGAASLAAFQPVATSCL